MSGSLTYKKDNSYIKMAQFKEQLSLQQHRIFDTLILILQKTNKYTVEDLKNEKEIVFPLDEFKDYLMMNVKAKKINRKDLDAAADDLMNIKLSFDVNDGQDEDYIEKYTIFQYSKMDFKANTVKFIFSKKFASEAMIPLNKNGKFTLLSSSLVNSLSRTYSRLLYQHFKMLIGHNNFKNDYNCSAVHARRILGITGKVYQESNKLYSKILVPAIKEINDSTDLIASVEAVKKGRNIKGFYFQFRKKDSTKKPFVPLGRRENNEDNIFNPNTLGEDIIELVNNEKDEEIVKHCDKFESELQIHEDIKPFTKFKNYIIEKFSGKELINNVNGYNAEVVFSLTPSGYIENDKGIAIAKEDALKVWEFLYENQASIGIIKKVSNLEKAKKYIGKIKEENIINIAGAEETINKILINIQEIEENKFKLYFRDENNPDNITAMVQLLTLDQISTINFNN